MFVISVAIAEAQGKLTVPPLTGRIVDQAALLDAAAEERISSRLAVLEADTGAQLAVLTIPSLQGEALEPFAIEVARTWALGQTGRDNGLLILVSRDDREVRIEVGRGLEGALRLAAPYGGDGLLQGGGHGMPRSLRMMLRL